MQDSVHSGLSLPGPMVYRYTMTFPFPLPQSRFPKTGIVRACGCITIVLILPIPGHRES